MLFAFRILFLALSLTIESSAIQLQGQNRFQIEKLEQLYYTLENCVNEISTDPRVFASPSYITSTDLKSKPNADFKMNCRIPTEDGTKALSDRKEKLSQMQELIEKIRKQPLSIGEENYLKAVSPLIKTQLAHDSNEYLFRSLCRDEDSTVKTVKCPESKTFKELQELYQSIGELKSNNLLLPKDLTKKYFLFYEQLMVIFQEQRHDLIESALSPLHEIELLGQELGLKISLPKIKFGFEDNQNGDDDTDRKVESVESLFQLLEEHRSMLSKFHNLEIGCVTYGENSIHLTSDAFIPKQSPSLRMIFNLSEDACLQGSTFSEEVKSNFEKFKHANVHLSNQTQSIQKFVEQTGQRLTILRADIEEVFNLIENIEHLQIRHMKKFSNGFYIATWGQGVEVGDGDSLSIHISAKPEELQRALDLNYKNHIVFEGPLPAE